MISDDDREARVWGIVGSGRHDQSPGRLRPALSQHLDHGPGHRHRGFAERENPGSLPACGGEGSKAGGERWAWINRFRGNGIQFREKPAGVAE
jgi:hypothetical protein